MDDDAGAARRARLAAIRAAAEAEAASAGEGGEPEEQVEEPVIKFRTYVPRHAEGLTFERVRTGRGRRATRKNLRVAEPGGEGTSARRMRGGEARGQRRSRAGEQGEWGGRGDRAGEAETGGGERCGGPLGPAAGSVVSASRPTQRHGS